MKHALLLGLALAAGFIHAPPARAESIRVGAAVSLKEALTDIAAVYQADTGDSVEFVFGSTGQIAAQIQKRRADRRFRLGREKAVR